MTDSLQRDPSENVKDLSDASSRRQDDLRAAQDALTNEKIRRIEEIGNLRAAHAREIRDIESKRLDAIRQVDVLNQTTAAERQLTAIQTLAATTTASAEALRSTVANTATTIAAQTAGAMATVNERLSSLERTSYEGTGRRLVDDPRMLELLEEVKSLRESRAGSVGGAEAIERARQQTARFIGAAVALAGVIITVIVKFA